MAGYTAYDKAVNEIAPQLQYSAEFVPLSKSRNANEKHPTLNWRVTFTEAHYHNVALTVDFSQGIGLLPDWATDIRRACDECGILETGKLKTRPIDAPAMSDVLHSLLLDAEAIDFATFEGWADSFGYDADSRKAESIYRACVETGLKLRAMLGDATIERLREALQDM